MSHNARSSLSTGVGGNMTPKKNGLGMVLSNDGPLSNRMSMKLRGERMPGLKDAPSSRKGIKHLM